MRSLGGSRPCRRSCAVDALREMMLKGADLASASLQLDLAVIGAFCALLIVAVTATLRREVA